MTAGVGCHILVGRLVLWIIWKDRCVELLDPLAYLSRLGSSVVFED